MFHRLVWALDSFSEQILNIWTPFRYKSVLGSTDLFNHGVQRRMISVDNFFVFLRLLFFCFVVAICDLVHNVETIFHLSYVLKASGNLF